MNDPSAGLVNHSIILKTMIKQILILSPFFHPEPISTGRYNSFLAKALVKKGISMDVICFHPLYPDWRPRRSDDSLSGVKIFRSGAWIRYPKTSLLRRVVLEGCFLLHLIRYAGRIKRYPHIVAVLPPMLFLPFIRFLAAPNTKITAITHDLQGIMAGIGFNKNRSKVVDLIQLLERMVLRCCHKIIVLSNSMASILLDRYRIPSSKIAVCWPFVTVDIADSGLRMDHLFASPKKHIIYAGALGEKQNPEGLISFFLDLVNRRGDVVCHIFSRGPVFDFYRGISNTDNHQLMFHDLVPERDLAELYRRSDIQIIPEKIGFSQGAIPSKLPNLLAVGVPIIYIGEKNSDVRQIIEAANAGLCADSWNLDRLYELTDRLLLESDDRSREDRRLAFDRKFATLFSVDTLVKELI